MSVQGRIPTDVIQSIIAERATPITVYRQTDAADEETLGAPTSSDYEDVGTRDVYLYRPQETSLREVEGTVVEGGLVALCLDGVDVDVSDRMDYGSEHYEVTSRVERPTHNPHFAQLELERV